MNGDEVVGRGGFVVRGRPSSNRSYDYARVIDPALLVSMRTPLLPVLVTRGRYEGDFGVAVHTPGRQRLKCWLVRQQDYIWLRKEHLAIPTRVDWNDACVSFQVGQRYRPGEFVKITGGRHSGRTGMVRRVHCNMVTLHMQRPTAVGRRNTSTHDRVICSTGNTQYARSMTLSFHAV